MKPRKVRDIDKALTKKGFEKIKTHHVLYILHVDGEPTRIRTFISNGLTEYDNSLLGKMKNQLGFNSQSDFEKLLDCPLGHEEYVEILKRDRKFDG